MRKPSLGTGISCMVIASLLLSLPLRAGAGEPETGVELGSLTLTSAIQLALQNNLGARVEGIQTQIADTHIAARVGEFEPSFNFSGRYESNAKPQNTQEFVA